MIKITARVIGGNFDIKINGQIETNIPTIICTSLRLDSGFQRRNERADSLIIIKKNIVIKNRKKVLHSLAKGFHMGKFIG